MTTRAGAVFCAAAILLAGGAHAADKPLYGPPPPWVKPTEIPKASAPSDGSAIQVLLADSQSQLGPQSDATYAETAVRVLTPQGLATLATLSYPWNPDTETLTLHRMSILRDGKAIDLMAAGKSVTVLRRETNLEQATLDGELTATVQPEGLQVGDIVDIAMTIERRDPVLHGHSEGVVFLAFPGAVARFRVRETWPAGKAVRWRATDGFPSPVLDQGGGASALAVDAMGVLTPKPPVGAPSRFSRLGTLEVSDFASWAEVSALMAPLYAKAATIAPGSPLQTEIDRLRRISADPKTRAEAALRAAQDQIHYVALTMNFGGYIPAAADLTWSRRFGDCKGKTALLLALLHGLGIEAEPALVNTTEGDGLDERLPSLAFDHVIVRARIGGKTYWLDATRTGDRDLDDIPAPDFHWALPVQTADAKLEKLEPPPLQAPAFESVARLDASAGLDAPAKAHVEQIYRGDAAVGWRLILDEQGESDRDRSLREYFRQQFPWLEPKSVGHTYDDPHRVMRLVLDGEGKMDWAHNDPVREFEIPGSNLGYRPNFHREPGPGTEAPFAVDYPQYVKWTMQIRLPSEGMGFTLGGGPLDVDTNLAGHRYLRHTRLDAGVVTMVAEDRTEVPEIAASQARAAEAKLRELARYDVQVRSPAASSIAEQAPPPEGREAESRPATPLDYTQRGARELEGHSYDRAIDDFTQAARLEPQVAKHLYDRGVAKFEKRDLASALSDFDAALALDPDDGLALMARGDIEFIRGERARAEADYGRALARARDPADVLARRANDYDQLGLFREAAGDYGQLIAQAKDGAHRTPWLNGRCWARAEWGRELSEALVDCNEALDQLPGSPDILDSRAFVKFRLGRYADAVSDYDAALQLAPRRATSVYGRGLAKIAAGQVSEGRADVADARALDPKVVSIFSRYGVRAPDPPPAGAAR